MHWLKIAQWWCIALLIAWFSSSSEACDVKNWRANFKNSEADYNCLQKGFISRRKTGTSDTLMEYYGYQIDWNLARGRLEMAQTFSDSLSEINREVKNPFYQQTVYNALARIQYSQGRLDSSLRLFQMAQDIASERNDSNDFMITMNNMAGIYAQKGMRQKELDLLLKITTYNQRSNYECLELELIDVNLAHCYVALNSGHYALKAAERALERAKNCDNAEGTCHALLALAESYNALEQLDNRKRTLFQTIKQSKTQHMAPVLATALVAMANVHLQNQDLDSAWFYLTRATGKWQKMGNGPQIANINIQKAHILIQHDSLDKAIALLDSNQKVISKYGIDALKEFQQRELSVAHEKNGNHEKALFHLKNYLMEHDTAVSRRNNLRVAFLHTQNEENKLEGERRVLQVENKRHRSVSYLLIALAVISVLSIALLYLQKQKNHKVVIENKDKIFSVIAHDLRGPVGNLNQLLEFMEEGEEKTPALSMAKNSAQSAYDLLEELLIWAKGNISANRAQKSKVVAANMIGDVLALLSSAISKKNISVNTEVNGSLVLNCNETLTKTIVRNIVNNAIKFTPEGGAISIAVKSTGNYNQIDIADTGAGIPKEVIEQLEAGEKIHSTRGTSGETGTGLGLRMCKEFVESQKGKMLITAEQGKGTTFSILLPK